MIAGPNQSGRTLIELYVNKLSTDPRTAAELFADGATYRGQAEGKAVSGTGRAQIEQLLAGFPRGGKYRITAHKPAQGPDNYAEIAVEGPNRAAEIQTVRFRNNGHFLTDLEVTESRKA
jgi:hypothetical protein